MSHRGAKKRVTANNNKELCEVHVVLLPQHRSKPPHHAALEGEYEGQVNVKQCARHTDITRATLKTNRALSCAPYFVFAFPDCEFAGGGTFTARNGAWCRVERVITTMDEVQLEYLMDEMLHCAHGVLNQRAMVQMGAIVREILQEVQRPVNCSSTLTLISRGGRMLYQRLEMFRIPLLCMLYEYLVPDAHDADQRTALAHCRTEQLVAMYDMVNTRPWDAVWYDPFKLHYGVHPLRQAGYTSAMAKVVVQCTPAMRIAVSIYFRVCQSQADDKHTVFSRIAFADAFPAGMPLADRVTLETDVYNILEARAVTWVEQPRKRFARTQHYVTAHMACHWLERIHTNHVESKREPALRGVRVPCLFPQLTQKQSEIADYIRTHWLTIVEGSPGTGKTSVITWVLSHWRNVMLTGFVGMLVKMLQQRNGGRPEVAHTIHKLMAMNQEMPEVRAWFAKFEVLVIDEFSNVSMQLFANVLSLFPNVCKLVLVGDRHQLKSFECGDAMGDMLHVFGDFCAKRLTENLRVAPALRTLQDVPRHILNNQPERIEAVAPVYFVARPILRTTDDGTIAYQACLSVLTKVANLPGGRSVMNTHCVALYNAGPDGRATINNAMERAWTQLNIINPRHPDRIMLRNNFSVYPGAKIMFTHNYNTPTPNGGAPVSNGELCYVMFATQKKDGGIMLTVTDSQDEDAEVKQVWIHKSTGVAPHHVHPGYASTTYTAQGREFLYVIYWCPNVATTFTQRAHTYVATSRARQALWIVGTPLQLNAVCRVPDRARQTCFRIMLQQCPVFSNAETCCDIVPAVTYTVSPRVPTAQLVCDADKAIACVPVIVIHKKKKSHNDATVSTDSSE